MKDEIKEILNKMEDISYKYTTNWLELHYKDVKMLYDYITNLQEENQKFKNWINVLNKNNHNYKSRNEKAIEAIDLVIELIKQQPTKDDSWILSRLYGFKFVLNGGDDNE